jgi:hypothetical protein
MNENFKTGDYYFFVSDDLCVGSGVVTNQVWTDSYARQEARYLARNFFQTFAEAKEMADKVRKIFER